MTKLQIYSNELCASRSLGICYKFLYTALITSVVFFGFEKQISVGVNGFFLQDEQTLHKPVPQRIEVPQINPSDIAILMDKSRNATVRKFFFHYDTYYFK